MFLKGTSRTGPASSLKAADESAAHYDDGDLAVVRCPQPESEPVQVLMWHVQELGGGYFTPPSRSDTLVAAYATLVTALEVDVWMLLGVRRGREKVIVPATMDDGSFCLRLDDGPSDPGVAEIDRILAELETADPAAGWKLTLEKDDEGNVVYQDGSTTAVLYRSGKGLELAEQKIVEGKAEEEIDLACELLAVTFDVSDRGPPWQLHVCAPLRVLARDAQAEENGGASEGDPRGEDEEESAIETSGPLPEPCLLALSTPADLQARRSNLSDLCRQLDADPVVLRHGTVLSRPYWEGVLEAPKGFVENPLGLNPSDVRLHDQYMHWEALELPDHPDELDDAEGRAADAILVRNGSSAKPLQIAKLRVVDLLGATLPADSPIRGSAGDASGPEEDGVLTGALKEHRAAETNLASSEDEEDGARTLAACVDFVRRLSDHWPLVAEVQPSSRS